MKLSKPTVGWIFWTFDCQPEPFTIAISNIFNSLDNIWFGLLELAHGFLPQTLTIDEEGAYLLLVASEVESKLKLIARLLDDTRKQIFFEHHWLLDRVALIELIGKLFGDYFQTDFDAQKWANGRGHTQLAGLLPWDFPAQIAKASLELDSLTPAEMNWALASRLNPELHPVFKQISQEDRLELFVELTVLRRSLVCSAWREDTNINWYDQAFPANTHYELYKQDYEQVRDLFESLEMMRDGHPDYAWLAETEIRERLLGEYADKLLEWDCQLIQTTQSLLQKSNRAVTLNPAWQAVYDGFQLVETLERVLLNPLPKSSQIELI